GRGVAGAYAERMQLHDLAREGLVEALAATETGHRVWSDRARIVEIVQHRGMGLDREQHVGEPAEHMRPDRLALEGAGDCPHLVGRDAEMVRPEPYQPLDEPGLGIERA